MNKYFCDRYNKAVTFSYDDGVTQDKRLIELFDKYNLKSTFNINSELLGQHGELIREGVRVSHIKNKPEEIANIYKDHEIAAHTLTHPFLPDLSDDEIVRQVEQDRLNLEKLSGKSVVGMAYPGGGTNFNEHVADVIRSRTNIKYCRTTVSSHSFDLQDDLYVFKPSVYHHDEWDKLFELGRRFVELDADKPQIFYVWGHAYEFDIHNTWDRFEEFCKLISGHDDIFYGTNREVFGL
ncbi:MAG: polysaccharide deacetylase family protein [Clostridiales bacterium]|nr:polysaccharide deacetylase family protein [Clostridiales bacterium]